MLFFNYRGLFFCLFMFFFGVFVISLYNVHYILILLSLEILLLSVYGLLGLYFFDCFGLYGLFFYLMVVVCMGGYGVSLLVYMSRYCGRDF